MSLTSPKHPPIQTKSGDRDNWIERSGPGGKGGHLPGPIDAIARALIAKGWDKGRSIATAVNNVKRGCATGKAFGGKADLKPETRATMCRAAASWEAKKKAGSVKEGVGAIALTGRDLDALYEAAESALLRLQAQAGGRDALMEVLAEGLFDESKHRRGANGRWVRDSLFGNQVTYERPVRVDSMFGKDQYGHVQGVDSETGNVHVRIEDPGPEFAEDLEGISYEQAEFVDVVSYRSIRDAETGEALPNPAADVTALKADHLRQKAVRQNAARMKSLARSASPSVDQRTLDVGLRTRMAEEAAAWLAVLDGAQGALRLTEAWEPLMEKLVRVKAYTGPGGVRVDAHVRGSGGLTAGVGGQTQGLTKKGKLTSGTLSIAGKKGKARITDGVGKTRRIVDLALPIQPDKDGVHHVGSDVAKAAELLSQGKKVSLNQPRQVSTLIDQLAKVVNEAKEKGEDAPNFNLCNVTVKKTSLFCVDNKGIPRIQMPQLSGPPTPGSKADGLPKDKKGKVDLTSLFRENLTGAGHKVSDETEKASYLKASQNELNGGKVAGMTKVLDGGGELGGDPRLFVSADNYIVDGHHRWAAKVAHDAADNKLGDVEIPVARVDMSIIELLAEANRFAREMGIPQAAMSSKPAVKESAGSLPGFGPEERLMEEQVLMRLPNGRFAPKGRGLALRAGQIVRVPHKEPGKPTVRGRAALGGRSVFLETGPDKGYELPLTMGSEAKAAASTGHAKLVGAAGNTGTSPAPPAGSEAERRAGIKAKSVARNAKFERDMKARSGTSKVKGPAFDDQVAAARAKAASRAKPKAGDPDPSDAAGWARLLRRSGVKETAGVRARAKAAGVDADAMRTERAKLNGTPLEGRKRVGSQEPAPKVAPDNDAAAFAALSGAERNRLRMQSVATIRKRAAAAEKATDPAERERRLAPLRDELKRRRVPLSPEAPGNAAPKAPAAKPAFAKQMVRSYDPKKGPSEEEKARNAAIMFGSAGAAAPKPAAPPAAKPKAPAAVKPKASPKLPEGFAALDGSREGMGYANRLKKGTTVRVAGKKGDMLVLKRSGDKVSLVPYPADGKFPVKGMGTEGSLVTTMAKIQGVKLSGRKRGGGTRRAPQDPFAKAMDGVRKDFAAGRSEKGTNDFINMFGGK